MSDIVERLALLKHGAVYTDLDGSSVATDAIDVIEELRGTINSIDDALHAELTDMVGTCSAMKSIRDFVSNCSAHERQNK